MAWLTLGEALEAALASRLNEVGLDGVGAPSDAVNVAKSRKNAGTEAPASGSVHVVSGDTALPANKIHTSKERRIAPASPKAGKGSPSPAVRRSLFVVVEGGLSGAHVRRPRLGAPALRVAWNNRSTTPDANRRTRPA